jgi:hypothetical protein
MSKFGQRGCPIRLSLSLEFDERLEADAPMCAHFAVLDLSLIEQLDWRRAGNIEHIRRISSLLSERIGRA